MKNQKLTKKIAVSASKIIKEMAVFSANSASPFGIYQPIEPKEIAKFKKFKK